MSSLLKIKPTRKEILGLISQALRAQRTKQADAIDTEIAAIHQSLEKRREAHRKAVEKSVASLPSTSRELKTLRRHAKKLGLTESSRETGNSLVFTFAASVTIPIDYDKLPKAPEYTPEEKERINQLRTTVTKLRHSHIDESCIVAHLVENNEELLQQVQEVASKIAVSLENGTAKLLEGTVE